MDRKGVVEKVEQNKISNRLSRIIKANEQQPWKEGGKKWLLWYPTRQYPALTLHREEEEEEERNV